MRKNLFKNLLTVVIAFTLSISSAVILSADSDIRVIVEGQEISFTDQTPVIVDGRTLVPIRDVFEAMGFDVDWNEEFATALLSYDDGFFNMSIEIGSPYFSVFIHNPNRPAGHAVIVPLDVPAQIIGGRTMLPLRALLEYAGYGLDWDEVTRTITITAQSAHTIGASNVTDAVVNIRHLLRADLDDVRDVLGEQTSTEDAGMWTVYSFDSGVQIGTDGNTIMSIWLDYREVGNRFHFNGLSGASVYDDVVDLFGSEPYDYTSYFYGFFINEDPREFVRFYFADNGEIMFIRFFG